MKQIFKAIVIYVLTLEAKVVIRLKKPLIVAVVGSVGKTSTKDAIYSATHKQLSVRKNSKSLNSEFGVPLTILGLESGWNNPVLWLKNVWKGLLALSPTKKYPAYLVLEVGTDMPGDMRRTASWLRPDVVVITSLPDLPVHVEHFDSPSDLRDEDASILSYMKEDGLVILNIDDDHVSELQSKITQRTLTYGVRDTADITFSSYAVDYVDGMPTGMNASIFFNDQSYDILIPDSVGQHHMYAITAGFAVSIGLGIAPSIAVSGLSTHATPAGRMKLLDGIYESVIIDDSYNASPIATEKAIETLALMEVKPGAKKIAVLGSMLELGDFSKEAHEIIGDIVAKSPITNLYTYGDEAEVISQSAISNGMSADAIAHFKTHEDIVLKLQGMISSGDILLIKGSQGSRMEKVIKPLLRNKQDVQNLVRQEYVWNSI